ncbi:TPA: hypothetical protein ACRG3Y_005915, partial [Klebsiella pneumoniae]
IIDKIKIENPNNVSKKSTRKVWIMILSLTNIAINGKTQASIRVAPVVSRFKIIFGRIFVCFRANIMPSGLELAELNIEIAARTKPNRMPATVDNTPAVLKMSVCAIGLIYLFKIYVSTQLAIMLIMIFMNI